MLSETPLTRSRSITARTEERREREEERELEEESPRSLRLVLLDLQYNPTKSTKKKFLSEERTELGVVERSLGTGERDFIAIERKTKEACVGK